MVLTLWFVWDWEAADLSWCRRCLQPLVLYRRDRRRCRDFLLSTYLRCRTYHSRWFGFFIDIYCLNSETTNRHFLPVNSVQKRFWDLFNLLRSMLEVSKRTLLTTVSRNTKVLFLFYSLSKLWRALQLLPIPASVLVAYASLKYQLWQLYPLCIVGAHITSFCFSTWFSRSSSHKQISRLLIPIMINISPHI